MKLILDNREYRVWWHHHERKGPMGGIQPVTDCFISDGPVGMTQDEWQAYSDQTPTSMARVALNLHDPPNRNKARKFALAKMLRHLFPCHPKTRAHFWDAYRTQLGHW